MARPEKYQDDYHQTGRTEQLVGSLEELNALAARTLKEQIVSERMLLTRYHQELSGAVHVLEYPQLPPEDMHKKHPLLFRDFNDISSEPGNGDLGRLGGAAFAGKRFVRQ